MVLFEINKFNLICFLLLRETDLSYFCDQFSSKNGQKTSLNQVQRIQIVTLFRDGYSERKISTKCNVSKTAVHTAIVNWRLKRSYSNSKRSGNPKKTTVRDDHLLRRMVVQPPTSFIKKVQSALLAKGVKVSDMTVSRRFTYDFGLKLRNTAKKPLSTKSMKSKRLAFA